MTQLSEGLLSGTRVVSFNHFLAGPMGAQILGDLGADVIAVEPLGGAFQRNWAVGDRFVDGQSVNHLCTGRNKRNIALDLKAPAGLEAARKMVRGADVVMESFRPGTMERLGLGYQDIAAVNPGVIYASATGYGVDGPYRDKPGQDLLIQALSGLAARTGDADGPPTPVGPTVVDQHAGVIYAMAILAALLARQKTGRGRRVDVNLLAAALDLQCESLTCYANGGRSDSPRGPGNLAAWFSPAPYGIYATADGHIAISMTPIAALAKALSLPALAEVPEAEAFTRREEIAAEVRAAVAARETAHWLDVLETHKVWHAEVKDYDAVLRDPQVQHNGAIQTLPGATGVDISLVMHPVKYDGETPPVRLAPQPLGAQTREILSELGYSEAEVRELEASKAVGAQPAAQGR